MPQYRLPARQSLSQVTEILQLAQNRSLEVDALFQQYQNRQEPNPAICTGIS